MMHDYKCNSTPRYSSLNAFERAHVQGLLEIDAACLKPTLRGQLFLVLDQHKVLHLVCEFKRSSYRKYQHKGMVRCSRKTKVPVKPSRAFIDCVNE